MLNSYYSDAFFETKVLPDFCFQACFICLKLLCYPFIGLKFRRFDTPFLV